MPTAHPPPRSIIVRLPNWVGDVVLATPLLAALRLAFPNARIALLGKRRLLDMLAGVPWFDETVALVADRSLAGPFRTGLDLRGRGYDTGLLLPNSFRSALLFRLAGIPRRIGYALQGRSFLLTDALPVARWDGRLRAVPMVDYYLALGQAIGVPAGIVPRRPVLPRSAEADARAARMLEVLGARPGEALVALNPGAAFGPSKLWPEEHWARLGDAITAELGARVLILCGPGEETLALAIAARMRTPPLTTAREVVPLASLAALLARCALLISTDSGPRHFGVAAGIPVIGLLGPTHPAYTELDYDRGTVLREDVSCSPCHLRVCPIDHRCMTRLSPERVLEAARRVLAGAAR